MRMVFAALLAALVTTAVAVADTTGGIRGYVYDPDGGAAVSGARVTLTSPAATAETTTNHAGFFTMLDLPPGYYHLYVERDGYKPKYTFGCISAGYTRNLRIAIFRAGDLFTIHPWSVLGVHPGQTADVYGYVGDPQQPRAC